MILTIRPATLADTEWVSKHLRDEDRREVETASGRSAQDVVLESFRLSAECYTIRLQDTSGRIDENPAVIFGVSKDPSRPGVGVMWLLGTPAMRRGALSIMREAPKWLDHFNRRYPNGIHNVVDTRNDLHIRWLMLTGFHFGITIDIQGVPFVHVMRHSEGQT